jgi:hypothetical protein
MLRLLKTSVRVKREEVIRGLRKLNDKNLRDLCCIWRKECLEDCKNMFSITTFGLRNCCVFC